MPWIDHTQFSLVSAASHDFCETLPWVGTCIFQNVQSQFSSFHKQERASIFVSVAHGTACHSHSQGEKSEQKRLSGHIKGEQWKQARVL